MKSKLKTLCYCTVMTLALIWLGCQEKSEQKEETVTPTSNINPQPLPEVVPGFNFPEDSSVIYKWLEQQNTENITKHAWGIWAGLKSNSSEVYKGDTLLIYETWLGITDIAQLSADSMNACDAPKLTREQLSFPHQLNHATGSLTTTRTDENPGFYVSVSYDPNAACFATDNLLLNKSTITNLLVKDGIGIIKPFPINSITIKPTYFIGKVADSLIAIPAWQGPAENLSQVYPPASWHSYIYIDVSNSQAKGKRATPVADTMSTPPSSAIVNLNEFIYYPLDSTAVDYMNKQQIGQTGDTLHAGDLAILVCMHVATKEISNWTWQTFFWTTDPATPDFPSSELEASLRPGELKGAASHYAVSTTYAMVWPNQPITGGTNEGVIPVIGYNPYLEPGLSKFDNTNNLDPDYSYGMQTNCMSCHALARSNATNAFTNYTGDQYIDMRDTTLFNNQVQLDFAWSIQSNLNNDK